MKTAVDPAERVRACKLRLREAIKKFSPFQSDPLIDELLGGIYAYAEAMRDSIPVSQPVTASSGSGITQATPPSIGAAATCKNCGRLLRDGRCPNATPLTIDEAPSYEWACGDEVYEPGAAPAQAKCAHCPHPAHEGRWCGLFFSPGALPCECGIRHAGPSLGWGVYDTEEDGWWWSPPSSERSARLQAAAMNGPDSTRYEARAREPRPDVEHMASRGYVPVAQLTYCEAERARLSNLCGDLQRNVQSLGAKFQDLAASDGNRALRTERDGLRSQVSDLRAALGALVAEAAPPCCAPRGATGPGPLADGNTLTCDKPARWGVATAYTCDLHRGENQPNEIGGVALRQAFAILASMPPPVSKEDEITRLKLELAKNHADIDIASARTAELWTNYQRLEAGFRSWHEKGKSQYETKWEDEHRRLVELARAVIAAIGRNTCSVKDHVACSKCGMCEVTHDHDKRCHVLTLARAVVAVSQAKETSWNDCTCLCHALAGGGFRGAHCSMCRPQDDRGGE